MESRIVDQEIKLVKYYPNYSTALAWYQDPELCKQVDNRDSVYDLDLLKAMYKYLDQKGDLFYIKYKNRLCGDVCLQPDGEINIVVAKPFQNKHIGRRVINEIMKLAKEKGIPSLHAVIYSFNTQSQKMFQSVGFRKVDEEKYVLSLAENIQPSDKISLFETLNCDEMMSAEHFYDVLEKCDALKTNYHEYMTTAPINCDEEVRRLSTADYDLCCALLTMLLREDHFCNGSFDRRQRCGQVKPIVERLIDLLKQENATY